MRLALFGCVLCGYALAVAASKIHVRSKEKQRSQQTIVATVIRMRHTISTFSEMCTPCQRSRDKRAKRSWWAKPPWQEFAVLLCNRQEVICRHFPRKSELNETKLLTVQAVPFSTRNLLARPQKGNNSSVCPTSPIKRHTAKNQPRRSQMAVERIA